MYGHNKHTIPFVGFKCVFKGMHKKKETTIEWTKVQRVYFGVVKISYGHSYHSTSCEKNMLDTKLVFDGKHFMSDKLVKKRQKIESFKDEK